MNQLLITKNPAIENIYNLLTNQIKNQDEFEIIFRANIENLLA